MRKNCPKRVYHILKRLCFQASKHEGTKMARKHGGVSKHRIRHSCIASLIQKCSEMSYPTVYPPVCGDNPRAFARGLSPRIGGQTVVNLVDYIPYRRTNRGITILYQPDQCRPCSV